MRIDHSTSEAIAPALPAGAGMAPNEVGHRWPGSAISTTARSGPKVGATARTQRPQLRDRSIKRRSRNVRLAACRAHAFHPHKADERRSTMTGLLKKSL